ncbi:MAG: tetratricopeptide (TPR) repeat protein [Crocinitomix sp.]|jgi:tetratricopeptide (TPR) repeat protein
MKHLVALFIAAILVGCSRGPEAIVNQEAANLYAQAQEASEKGLSGWGYALDAYNKANELEPENPIILHARGQFKIMSEMDIEGGFEDHAAAIKFSKDSFNLKMRYSNRALDYLKVGDICSACEDWKRAGDADNYIEKYCDREFDNILKENKDDRITLDLALNDSVSYIGSVGMSKCNGVLRINNNSHPTITFKYGLLDYGHEFGGKSGLFLEALDLEGSKFPFFNESSYTNISQHPNTFLEMGEQLEKELNIFQHHQFAYAGNYKVRVGFRPSLNVKGLKSTYYSNWVDVAIVRK